MNSNLQRTASFGGKFRGRYPGSLDAQDRFSVPSVWRKQVEKFKDPETDEHVELIAFPVDYCNKEGEVLFQRLVVAPEPFAEARWDERQQAIEQEQDEDRRIALEMSLELSIQNSFTLSWDGNGRCKLPAEPMQMSAIPLGEKADLMFSGSGEKFEVWSATEYERFRSRAEERAKQLKIPHPMGFGRSANTSAKTSVKGTDKSNETTEAGA